MTTPTSLLADRYRLVKMLGGGGMGVVWQAWDERLRRAVAVKMLRAQPNLTDAERQDATDRAMREARITAGLHHPHAVTVFDVIEHEGQPCIVMQLVESTPLSDLLRENGALSPTETARIGEQVASALAAAHAMKIVHRDIKPGNILIASDGSAMISDFGIAHALGDATITATGIIHGTPAYLAPETARGLPTTFASDVFSLGSTLYAMVEGEPPFGSGKNPMALLHRVAKGGYPAPRNAGPLAPLLWEMLFPQPKRRPSMASVEQSLAGLRERADHAPAGSVVAPIAVEPPSRPAPPLPAPDSTGVTAVIAPEEEAADTDLARDAAPTDATAETEPLAGSDGVTPPGAPAPAGPMPPGPGPTSRRRTGVIAALVLVVGLAVAAAVIFAVLQRPPDPGAGSGADPATAPADATPTPSSPASTPEGEAAPPATEESTGPQDQVPPTQTAEERAIGMVSGYYALLPGDLDGAWPLMTTDYQENHAGGRGAYEAFWADIAAVQISDMSAPAPDQVQATLTYSFRDGSVVQEVTSYRLVDEGGVLKIAASEVLSSG